MNEGAADRPPPPYCVERRCTVLIPHRVVSVITACCLLALPSLLAGAEAPAPAPVPTVWSGDKPPFGFSGGADTMDALIDRFLAAVTAGDLEALNPLRVTQNEYGS